MEAWPVHRAESEEGAETGQDYPAEEAWLKRKRTAEWVWSRENAVSEEGAKQKSGWGSYFAEGAPLMERMEPEKWPKERWASPERRHPDVWVEPEEGVWLEGRGGSEERM